MRQGWRALDEFKVRLIDDIDFGRRRRPELSKQSQQSTWFLFSGVIVVLTNQTTLSGAIAQGRSV